MTLDVEIQRNLARGDEKVASNKFSGAIRSLEMLGLEEGDQFTIPESFEDKIYTQTLNGNKVEYIMVELTNGNAKPFYPSTFTKSRTIYEEDGTNTGVRVHTKGTAAELFRQYPGVNEGMEALKGKELVVSKIDTVRTLRYGRNELMNAQIPTIDIVEK